MAILRKKARKEGRKKTFHQWYLDIPLSETLKYDKEMHQRFESVLCDTVMVHI